MTLNWLVNGTSTRSSNVQATRRQKVVSLSLSITKVIEDALAARAFPGAAWGIVDAAGTLEVGVLGHVATHDGCGSPIAEAERRPVREDTFYDLASLTKVFTAVTILRLADEGVVGLDRPVGEWLPSHRSHTKREVTLAHLLSHTSGLPPAWPGWRQQVMQDPYGNARWMPRERATVLRDILEVEPTCPPGRHFEYSCLGYITAMAVAEQATGRRWKDLVRQRVLRPLGLGRTTFEPDEGSTAPTEYQPAAGRGMVHAVVHDETAYALHGGSGNAGLFSTVHDVLELGRAILVGLPNVLRPDTFSLLWEDQLPAMLGRDGGERVRSINGFGHSLGLRIGQDWMGHAAAQRRGHTGFTGTSVLLDPRGDAVVALLTNRVHPRRDGPDLAPIRAAVSDDLLRSPT